MRYFWILSALLLSSHTQATTLEDDKDKLMQSYFGVVMIRGYTENGGLAYGSGVVVAKDTAITNCHVLRATKQPWIARGEDIYNITTVKADTWHDLCLVTAPNLPFKPVGIGKTGDLKYGQDIVAIGHSNGVPAPLTSTGHIKGLYPSEQGRVIRSTAQFRMGASGSGLFDESGNLVGINTFKTAGRRTSIYFALPVEWLQALEKLPETKKFPITGKALWEEDEDKKPFYMQAAVPESREDWSKLQQIAQIWTKAEPTSTEAFYALGLAYENSAKPDLATKAYQQSASLDANNYEALVRLAHLAKARGDTAEVQRLESSLAAQGVQLQ